QLLGRHVLAAGQKGGDVVARRVAAGEDAGPRRRAQGTSGVGIGELHALRCKLVNVWRLVKRAAEKADVAPAHVVDEDEDKVGLGDVGGCYRSRADQETHNEQAKQTS